MHDIEFVENTDYGIIDNMLNELIEEDQVYKDKETVVSVMKNLAVRERFQFNVKKLSATRYHLISVDDNCAWSFKSSAVYKANIFKEVTKLHKSEDGSFLYAYVSLYASIKGWEHCRPITVVDESFFKVEYKGTILTACIKDGAGELTTSTLFLQKILPLAYAIVNSENNKSWECFFIQIKGTFGVREGMCIVSDRNESIFNATKVMYPEVPYCICIFHLWQNAKRTFKKYHKKLKEIFFALVRAYTIKKFEYHMIEMYKIDLRVQPYLFEIGYERWSRAYSKVKRSMWNNRNRKSAMETSIKLGEKYDKLLRKNLIASEQMTVRHATEQLYTVLEGVRRNIVCLEEGTCSCGRFQMDELSYPHAWAVLKNQQLKLGQYCSFYYKKDNLLRTYDFSLNPIPDEISWVIPKEVLDDVVLSPKVRKNAGKPRKKRLKPASKKEYKRGFSCSVCVDKVVTIENHVVIDQK
nr:uncharacterized protein LOC104098943 [Nicotiana tomentosiformis]